ncbi:MAG: hypothetical protein R2769_04405 [Saprospiraceae bacterium]
MKTIAVLTFLLGSFHLSSQVYFNLNYSNMEPVFTAVYGEEITEMIDGNEVNKIAQYSLGEGNQYGLNLGVRIKKGIYADLGVLVHQGEKIKIKRFSGPFRQIDDEIYGNFIALSPGIKLLLDEEKFISYYAKGALLIGFSTKMVESSESLETSSTPIGYDYIREYSKNIPLGGEFQLGLELNPTRNWTFSMALKLIVLEFTPRYSELTHFDVNGVSQLPKLNVRSIKTEYITTNANLPNGNENEQPHYEYIESYPLNGLGFTVGVQYWFGRKKE